MNEVLHCVSDKRKALSAVSSGQCRQGFIFIGTGISVISAIPFGQPVSNNLTGYPSRYLLMVMENNSFVLGGV